MLSSVTLLVLMGTFHSVPAFAQEQTVEKEIDFDCEPTYLYRGDTLTVTFLSPHDDADLAIDNADGQTMVISFKHGPEDKVNPVMPHDEFGKMQQVRLDTTKAQGSLMKDRAHGGNPAVLEPPQLTFTKTGGYQVIVGRGITSSNGEIDVCFLNYYDQKRPPMIRPFYPAPKTPTR